MQSGRCLSLLMQLNSSQYDRLLAPVSLSFIAVVLTSGPTLLKKLILKLLQRAVAANASQAVVAGGHSQFAPALRALALALPSPSSSTAAAAASASSSQTDILSTSHSDGGLSSSSFSGGSAADASLASLAESIATQCRIRL